ncbi:hypothetical protein CAPTEDRAFT_227793 [Capitella teleta]|uniref:tRNA (guanine-N(7)-)-methyltransferase non-catalytic subunit n=1 Tax=Capitella teleta TaxID=283909 RepID=R7VK14_CAPTE|nr:hypothetical protein CAPTEDRAFT_227793 [Capitella teleta]|eukprot:ELU16385.1 hypothetical protein CAPTEDRAFT_227793 [Capitella teleta]
MVVRTRVDVGVNCLVIAAVQSGVCSDHVCLRNEEGRDRILAAAFSHTGRFFAACDDFKQMVIWAIEAGQWKTLGTRSLHRRCTSVSFSRDESSVVVADKSGDVFQYTVKTVEGDGRLLLGHVSMILDACLCADDQLLVTADRDEKLRVSRFPNSYNIHGFCLGHKEFVSCSRWLDEEKLLLSGSGDGTLKLWDLESCDLKSSVDCRSQQTDDLEVSSIAVCSEYKIVVAGFNGKSLLMVYAIQSTPNPRLEFVQTLTLSGVLWDMTFHGGCLLVLQESESKPLLGFDIQGNKLMPTDDDVSGRRRGSAFSRLSDVVNERAAFFKECASYESIFASLHKARIDNMKEYIEKKKERMSAAQKRSKNSPDQTAAPVAKQAKS